MRENIKEISVILTLYKTPKEKLKNLLSYKNFKLLVFDQEGNKSTEKYLKKNLLIICNIFHLKRI